MNVGVLIPLRNLFNKPEQHAKLFETQDGELLAQMKVRMSDYFSQQLAVSGIDSVGFASCLFLLRLLILIEPEISRKRVFTRTNFCCLAVEMVGIRTTAIEIL
jgi:hypothetical protein